MLNLLLELQRLKNLERTGWILRGLPNGTESVAAHSFGVGVTAMLLADEFISHGVPVDLEKVLRMALLHDWAEVRIGDMPKTAARFFGPEIRKEAENKAFEDILHDAGELKPIYKEIYEEYEQRQSLEARIVKVADVVDLLIEALALEQAGARGLNEFWDVATEPDFQFEGVGLQIVEQLFQSLILARSEVA